MENVKITLELPLQQVGVILQCLALGPYRDVADTVNAIQNQAKPQVDAAQATPPKNKPKG